MWTGGTTTTTGLGWHQTATTIVERLFLKQEIKEEIHATIEEIKAWDPHVSSNQMVRTLRQEIEGNSALGKHLARTVIAITALNNRRAIPGKPWGLRSRGERARNDRLDQFFDGHSDIHYVDKNQAISTKRPARHDHEIPAYEKEKPCCRCP